MVTNKLQTYLGIGLVVVVLGWFIFSVVSASPKQSDIDQTAKTLPAIPDNLFSDSNATTKKINSLTVPANVPVTVDSGAIGRTNVFSNP